MRQCGEPTYLLRRPPMGTSEHKLPPISNDSRSIAVKSFEKANSAISTEHFDYAIKLLLECCRRDPGNFLFRQTLRRTQKAKFNNNLRGSRLAFFTTLRLRTKLKQAEHSRDYLKVLDLGEQILSKNPWDIGVQKDMAEAADALGLLDMAIFMLDQARQKDPKNPTINRMLARYFEKRGNFSHAINLWAMVKEAVPGDVEADHKVKDLTASETIQRGGYAEATAEQLADGEETPLASPKMMQAVDQAEKIVRETDALLARIQTNPSDPSLYLKLAEAYRRTNQTERVRATIEQGLGPTGNDFRLTTELMEIDLEPFRRNFALAEQKIKKAEAGEEDSRHSLEDLKKIHKKLLKEINSREIELFRVRADRYPQDFGYRMELGIRLAESDQLDAAISEFQQVRKDARLGWKACLHLGLCFKKRNNWRLAQRNLEEALASLPPNDEASKKEVLFQLASGFAEAGELQRAIDLGHDLANIDFGYKQIGKLLDAWEDRLQEA